MNIIQASNNNNNEELLLASENGYIDVVNRLMNDPRLVDPSANDNYAIRMASSRGSIEIINRLLEDPRVDPNDALAIASEKGYIEIKYINKRFQN